jgi:hypothetical protein
MKIHKEKREEAAKAHRLYHWRNNFPNIFRIILEGR